RRRLVEDEHAGPGGERLRELDELALRARAAPHRGAQRSRGARARPGWRDEAELGQDGPRALGHLRAPDERAAPRLAHREEVAQDVEVAEQAELLRDDR